MTWRFVIANADGTDPAELDGATDRSVTWNLSDYCTAEFSIDGRDDHAALIRELTTDLLVYRNNVLVYRGRVGATSDDLDANTHKVKVSTADYRWLLSKRTLWPTSTLIYTATEQSDIAWDLIADTQALSGGDWGITRGLGTTTGRTRDRTYEAGAVLGELLANLGNVIDGFDWEIDPLLAFNLYYPNRGILRDFAVTYSIPGGGGNTSKLSRALDPGSYANAIRVSGADAVGPTTRVAADIATRDEGRFEQQVSTDLVTSGAVTDAADRLLTTASDLQPSYAVTLTRDSGWSPDLLWLGDSCPLSVQSGRLDVNDTLRVTSIAVAVGDDGDEQPSITFGQPPNTLRSRLRGIASRVDNLARR